MQGTLVGAMWMAMALAWPSVSKLRPRTPFIQVAIPPFRNLVGQGLTLNAASGSLEERYGGIFRAHQKPSLVRKPSLVPKPYARKDIYELFGEIIPNPIQADEDAASDPALLPADFDFSGLDTHDLNADKEGRMKDDEKSVLALSRKEAEELLRLKVLNPMHTTFLSLSLSRSRLSRSYFIISHFSRSGSFFTSLKP
eukprot:1386978-Amorphochlora_amoeboformis.AAC.2